MSGTVPVLWRLVKLGDPLLPWFGKLLYACYWQVSAVWSWRRQKEINLQMCQEWMLPGCQVFVLLIFYRRRAEEAEHIMSVAISSRMNEVAGSCRWRSGCGRLSPCLIRMRWSLLVCRSGPDKWIQSDSELKIVVQTFWCFELLYPINPRGWIYTTEDFYDEDGISICLHHHWTFYASK